MQRIRLVILIILLAYDLIAFLDCDSAGTCTRGGALCCSFQHSLSFVGGEGVRAGDVPMVDHGKAHHLTCRCG